MYKIVIKSMHIEGCEIKEVDSMKEVNEYLVNRGFIFDSEVDGNMIWILDNFMFAEVYEI